MSRVLVILLFISVQSIRADLNQKVTRYWPMGNPSVSLFNTVRSCSYFFRIAPYVFLADEDDEKDIPEEEYFFLVCLHCNAAVDVYYVFGELLAGMHKSVADNDLFKKYYPGMCKGLNGYRKFDNNIIAESVLEVAQATEKICKECKTSSWQVLQKKEIDFATVPTKEGL